MLNRRKLAASNPLSAVPGCKVLLDARYRTTTVKETTANILCADGDLVGRWIDLSGNGNHYDAPTAGEKPTLSLSNNNCNNLPCLNFAGASRLYSPFGPSLPTEPLTIALVGSIQSGWMCGGQTVGGNRVIFSLDDASVSIYEASAFVTATLATGSDTISTASFFLGTFNGANSLVRAQKTETTGDPGTTVELRGITIGDATAEGAPFTGTVGFYALWNRELTLNERNFLYHYCTQAFGININK